LNPSTFIGIFGGSLLIGLSVYLTTDTPKIFFDGPSLLIVLGGTIAATFVSYPISEMGRLFRMMGLVLRDERLHAEEDVRDLVQAARLWFSDDLSSVERFLHSVKNPFLRTGIQSVLDGTPPDKVMDVLRWRIVRMQAIERAESQIFRTMAQFAPAFGMLGTLLGLINMLKNMSTGSVEEIGQSMAVALITTFYGLILANLIFKPFAVKLERRTEQRVTLMNMVLEGVLFLSERRSPSFINETLMSFLANHDDDIRDKGGIGGGIGRGIR
jgi:chemotaxis protein MotA